jgi:cobyric acid synthase
MLRILKYAVYFGVLAGIGIILGCYIHGLRTNQPLLMSGVAFVRELPQGERVVGYIETTVFSWQEDKALKTYKEEHKGNIKIDPKVLEEQKKLYKGSSGDR